MHSSLVISGLSLALGATAADVYPNYEYGNMFYLGPTTGGQYITRATYTLVPPSPPTNWKKSVEDKTWLSLWIGVQDNPSSADVLKINFVQPLLNWAPDQASQGCGADNKHWCAAASTYTPQGQEQQAYVAIDSGATLDFEISIDNSTSKIVQKIFQNGGLVSSQVDSAGMKPAVFYSGNECYGDGCGTLAAYSYTNITLVLSEAEENLGQLLMLTNATTAGFKTADGGVTWTCASIDIEEDELTE